MDIGSIFDLNAPSDMTAKHPLTGERVPHETTGEPLVLQVYSADSDVARRHRHAKQRERIQSGDTTMTPEDFEAQQLDFLAAMIGGWSWMVLDGVALPHSHANALKVMRHPNAAWLREQVDRHCGQRANFRIRPASPDDGAREGDDSPMAAGRSGRARRAASDGSVAAAETEA